MKWHKANTSNGQGLIIDEETGENIAVSYKEENAPLIASAPDLLEACKSIIGYHERAIAKGNAILSTHWLIILEQAIQKAEGK